MTVLTSADGRVLLTPKAFITELSIINISFRRHLQEIGAYVQKDFGVTPIANKLSRERHRQKFAEKIESYLSLITQINKITNTCETTDELKQLEIVTNDFCALISELLHNAIDLNPMNLVYLSIWPGHQEQTKLNIQLRIKALTEIEQKKADDAAKAAEAEAARQAEAAAAARAIADQKALEAEQALLAEIDSESSATTERKAKKTEKNRRKREYEKARHQAEVEKMHRQTEAEKARRKAEIEAEKKQLKAAAKKAKQTEIARKKKVKSKQLTEQVPTEISGQHEAYIEPKANQNDAEVATITQSPQSPPLKADNTKSSYSKMDSTESSSRENAEDPMMNTGDIETQHEPANSPTTTPDDLDLSSLQSDSRTPSPYIPVVIPTPPTKPKKPRPKPLLPNIADHIPPDIKALIHQLQPIDPHVNLRGGAVRDILLGNTPDDFDIFTSASIDEVRRLYPLASPSEDVPDLLIIDVLNTHTGTSVKVDINCNCPLGSLPADFSVNALYTDPHFTVMDPDGQCLYDIEHKVIRLMGRFERLKEEPALPLRAISLCIKKGFHFDTFLNEYIKLMPRRTIIDKRIKNRLMLEVINLARRQKLELLFNQMLALNLLPKYFPLLASKMHTQKDKAHVLKTIRDMDKASNSELSHSDRTEQLLEVFKIPNDHLSIGYGSFFCPVDRSQSPRFNPNAPNFVPEFPTPAEALVIQGGRTTLLGKTN